MFQFNEFKNISPRTKKNLKLNTLKITFILIVTLPQLLSIPIYMQIPIPHLDYPKTLTIHCRMTNKQPWYQRINLHQNILQIYFLVQIFTHRWHTTKKWYQNKAHHRPPTPWYQQMFSIMVGIWWPSTLYSSREYQIIHPNSLFIIIQVLPPHTIQVKQSLSNRGQRRTFTNILSK